MSGVKEGMAVPLENTLSLVCRSPPSSMYLPWHKSRVPKLSGGQSDTGKVYTPALEEMGNYRHFNAFTIQYFLVALDCNRV